MQKIAIKTFKLTNNTKLLSNWHAKIDICHYDIWFG